MLVYSLYTLIFGSLLAAAAPVSNTSNHALLTSPLFNTPLSAPPMNSGTAISRRMLCFGLLGPNYCLNPPPAPARNAEDIHSRSNNDAAVNNTSPDDPVSTTITVTVSSTGTPLSFTSSSECASTTSVMTIPEESCSTSSTAAAPLTTTVTMTLQVTTLTLEPSTVTLTAHSSETPAVSSSKTGDDCVASVRSITILETVPFTTTDLPAVTVTGLQTLTSVVVVTVEASEETVEVETSRLAATTTLPVR